MTRLAPRSLVGAAAGLLVLVACSPSPSVTNPETAAAAGEPVPTAAASPEPSSVAAAERPDPVRLEGVEHPGCFMLLPLSGGAPGFAGEQPCDERTTPASTFKIPHALIALDTGVVEDPEALVKWDGVKRWVPAWNRDHSLRTAIYDSAVWFFQGTARAIGRERMREYLEAFDYGNATVEEPIDAFWLDEGSLRISAEEQLRFMVTLYGDEGLPRGQAHVPTLRELLVRPPSSFAGRLPDGVAVPAVHPELVFSAKTGTGGIWTSEADGSVTWLVGHVACPDREHVFVSRVIADEEPQSDSPAVAHGLAALDRLGVLRCEPG